MSDLKKILIANLITGFALIPFFCSAQEKPLIALPDLIEMSGRPGETLRGKFTVYNKGNLAVKMKIATKDFRVQEDGNFSFFWKEGSISEWLKPSAEIVELAANEEKVIDFSLAIPGKASVKGYLGSILFEAASQDSVGPKESFGVLVLANVLTSAQSAEQIKAEILSFDSNKINTSSPVNLALNINNPTQFNASLNGQLTIKDWRGRTVIQKDLGELFIFPGVQKTFSWKWNNKSLFGFFKAEIALAWAGGTETETSQSNFVIITIPAILILIGGLFIGLLAFKYRKFIYSSQTGNWFNYKNLKKKKINRNPKARFKIIRDIS